MLRSIPPTAAPKADTLSAPPVPEARLRRMRGSSVLRDMVRENYLRPEDMILPLFVEEGLDAPAAISSMPGIVREPEKTFEKRVRSLADSGVRSIILFGVSHHKDHHGSDSMKPDGLMARMIARAKNAAPDMAVIADLCFCEYTDHGHCGPLNKAGDVDNDMTIDAIARQAVTAAEAGADMMAPSGMMDGQVAAIRAGLDQTGFAHLPVMAYAAKYASCFYGPFRLAAGCALGKSEGVRSDRKTYQMDPANRAEAIREAMQDEAEGADILMVKPGMAYLDIIRDIREQTLLPVAAYQVSGEYAMIKHAAIAGALDENAAILESLIAFKRAGCDMILSYFTEKAIELIRP